jgi:hypothetical protein
MRNGQREGSHDPVKKTVALVEAHFSWGQENPIRMIKKQISLGGICKKKRWLQ